MADDGVRVLAGRYRLTERIGTGGAGTVWRGHDAVLRRPVAVKVLRASLRDSDRAIDQFRSEATAAADLTHPHTVMVYDVGVDDGLHYLVMELVEGPSLADHLARRKPLSPGAAVAIGRDVADALGAAHGRGVIHRDIKPGNILLAPAGTAKVADFGVARALDPAQTRLSSDDDGIVGSVPYLAPEQLDDRPITASSDIYSLGLVLHEALTGEPPFGEGTPSEIAARRLTGRIPHLGELRPDVPSGLAEIVHRATAPDPDERFEDGGAMQRALAPLVTREGRDTLRRLATRDPGHHDGSETRVLPVTDGAAEVVTMPPDDGDTTTREIPRTTDGPSGGRSSNGQEPRADTGRTPARDGNTTASDGDAPPPDSDAPAPNGRSPAPGGNGDTGRRRTWIIAAAGVLAGLVALVLVTGDGDDANGGGEPQSVQSPVAFQAAADFDPFGDGQEHPGDLPAAVDGDPGTAWVTERYNSADLGGLKPGVGLIVDLGDAQRLGALRLRARAGMDLEIYAADAPPAGTDPSAWGTRAASASGVPAEAEIQLEHDRPARYWLIWITRLPGPGRAEIAEVTAVAR